MDLFHEAPLPREKAQGSVLLASKPHLTQAGPCKQRKSEGRLRCRLSSTPGPPGRGGPRQTKIVSSTALVLEGNGRISSGPVGAGTRAQALSNGRSAAVAAREPPLGIPEEARKLRRMWPNIVKVAPGYDRAPQTRRFCTSRVAPHNEPNQPETTSALTVNCKRLGTDFHTLSKPL